MAFAEGTKSRRLEKKFDFQLKNINRKRIYVTRVSISESEVIESVAKRSSPK